MKQATLCFLIKDNQILLAMKKRGFGVGKWNGVGGKVNSDETPLRAIVREAQEEIFVEITGPKQVAVLNFSFPAKPEWNQKVTVYLCKDWKGEPIETEEMKPQWFNISQIPYDQMWSDDIYWLPKVLEGKILTGKFVFDKDQKMIEHELKI